MNLLVPAATLCFLLGALNVFLGVAVLRDGVRERLHRVTALMLFFGGLGAMLAGLGLALRANPTAGGVLFTDMAVHFASVWEFFFPSLLLFALVFPTEHPWLKRFGGLQELVFVPYVFHLVLTLVADQSGGDFFIPDMLKRASWLTPVLTPLRIGLGLVYDVHAVTFSLVNLGYIALTLTILGLRARGAQNPRLKAQMSVMYWGLTICLVFYSLVAPVPTLLGLGNRWERVAPPLLVLGLLAGSGSIAWSILRHRFLDARLLLRRTFAFLAVAGVLAVLYLQVLRRLEGFVEGFSALDMRVIEPVFLMTALVMLQPAVNRVEELIDRWLLRDRREGRALLQQTSRDLVALMDLETLGARLTHAVHESLATEGVVLLGRRSETGPLELVACAGFPQVPFPEWPRLAAEVEAVTFPERPLAARELSVREDAASARLASRAVELPLALIIPLHHSGRLLGALALAPKVTRTRFTHEDLALLATLGNQAAVALRNYHLLHESMQRAALEEELHLARQIQVSYLPTRFPRRPRMELAGVNVPSKQVGGDYYDFVDLPTETLVAVADVVGKGVPAALMMSMLQASLRTMAAGARTLTEMVVHLNELILSSGQSGKFATLFLARMDHDTLTLRYSNAGHNPPCLVRADGRVEWLADGGLLLGVMQDARPAECSVGLDPGDRLVLYTDGITEAANREREFFGESGLAETLRRLPPEQDAAAVVQGVMDSVRRFCDGAEPGDDMTLLVLRVPLGAGEAARGLDAVVEAGVG